MIILNDIYRISKNYYKKFYFSKKMSNFFHSMHTLISTQWLNLHRNENNIKIVDATWNLTNKNYALDVIEKRIKGSFFFDIDKIADLNTNLPHMIPSVEFFEKKVSELGINNEDHIIVYDRSGVFVASARVWWTFRLFGHEKISVLDGGLQKWLEEGGEWESGPLKSPNTGNFKVTKVNFELIKDMKKIHECIKNKSQIIDARPPGRFKGIEPEPRPGLKCGHIPGSINIPHTDILTNNPGKNYQTFLENEQLKEIFLKKGLNLDLPITISCGSGVNASVVALGLHLIGHKYYCVYDGSWTEWGKPIHNNPIETDI